MLLHIKLYRSFRTKAAEVSLFFHFKWTRISLRLYRFYRFTYLFCDEICKRCSIILYLCNTVMLQSTTILQHSCPWLRRFGLLRKTLHKFMFIRPVLVWRGIFLSGLYWKKAWNRENKMMKSVAIAKGNDSSAPSRLIRQLKWYGSYSSEGPFCLLGP